MEYVEKVLEVGYRELAFKSSRQLEPSLLMAYPCRVSVQIAGLEKKFPSSPLSLNFRKRFSILVRAFFLERKSVLNHNFALPSLTSGNISQKKRCETAKPLGRRWFLVRWWRNLEAQLVSGMLRTTLSSLEKECNLDAQKIKTQKKFLVGKNRAREKLPMVQMQTWVMMYERWKKSK